MKRRTVRTSLKLLVTDVNKINTGCRLTVSTDDVTNSWFGELVEVLSVNQLRNEVHVISPTSGRGERGFFRLW